MSQDYFHFRRSTNEFCYGYLTFKRLSTVAICRWLSIGDDWVDQERDADAAQTV